MLLGENIGHAFSSDMLQQRVQVQMTMHQENNRMTSLKQGWEDWFGILNQ